MTDDTANHDRDATAAIEKADLTYPLEPDERPTEAVVRAVASFTNTPILDLDPLYNVADPDHLDGLFDGTQGEGRQRHRVCSFFYNGCKVTVTVAAVHVFDRADDGSASDTE